MSEVSELELLGNILSAGYDRCRGDSTRDPDPAQHESLSQDKLDTQAEQVTQQVSNAKSA